MPNTQRPTRRSPRLKGYDYSLKGAYFVTICTRNRLSLFGEIIAGEMQLNVCGEIVQAGWDDLPQHYGYIQLDAFVVMPNHIHGVVVLDGEMRPVGEGLRPSPTTATPLSKRHGLTEIVRALKAFSAQRINKLRDTPGAPVWQRSFHDHIIRDERELNMIRSYIWDNPTMWTGDQYFG